MNWLAFFGAIFGACALLGWSWLLLWLVDNDHPLGYVLVGLGPFVVGFALILGLNT